MSTPTATPVKLSDGTWGAKVTGVKRVYQGMSIKIRTRSGQTWTTKVTATWSDDRDGFTVKTDPADKPASPKRSSKPRRKACVTGGNCSSFASGRSCGGYDCDGF